VPTVLITGASRGLGFEFTRQYAADGWRVLALARAAGPELSAAIAASGGAITHHALDVEHLDAIRALAETLRGTAIDVLINNAGAIGTAGRGSGSSRFGATDYNAWSLALKVNVQAPLAMAEAFVEHVAASAQKKIATLSSLMGSVSANRLGGFYAYRSSKAGVNAVVKSMALDLARRGIVCLALHPGWARTDMGGPQAELAPEKSVAGLRRVIAEAGAAQSGHFLQYDGAELPW
jgi:NAD(P)-dependent dehydrogenase (short-subunit alcohol dehydrogenase family)